MKRYDPYTGVMDEDPEGDFVLYEDYEKLLAEVKRLREALEYIAEFNCLDPHFRKSTKEWFDCGDVPDEALDGQLCAVCRARKALEEEG